MQEGSPWEQGPIDEPKEINKTAIPSETEKPSDPESMNRRDFLKRLRNYAVGGVGAYQMYKDLPPFGGQSDQIDPTNEENLSEEPPMLEQDSNADALRIVETLREEVRMVREQHGDEVEALLRERLRKGIDVYLAYTAPAIESSLDNDLPIPEMHRAIGMVAGAMPKIADMHIRKDWTDVTTDDLNSMLLHMGIGGYAADKIYQRLTEAREVKDPIFRRKVEQEILEDIAYRALLRVIHTDLDPDDATVSTAVVTANFLNTLVGNDVLARWGASVAIAGQGSH
jgi:hypothetical protein